MVEIRPFKALMYDWDEVDGEPATVTSPPYDVLTTEDVQRLKKQSAHNITHVTLPDPVPGKEEATRYAQAAKTLKRWRKEGILHQRKESALFVYDETYSVGGGARRQVRGLVALLALDPDYASVKPHERTHKGPIEDRFELMRATGTDLEPIQFLYKDTEQTVNRLLADALDDRDPLVSFTDPSGTTHALWPVDDPDVIEQVARYFAAQNVYIADGHHRYATACAYAAERRSEATNGGSEYPQPYDYKLSVFVNRDDPGLSVFPTHRLISGVEDVPAARTRLREHFRAEPRVVKGTVRERADELAALTGDIDRRHEYRFVFYWGNGEADVLTLPVSDVETSALGDKSDAWKHLDVVVLHHLVLPDVLDVTDANAGERLRYTRVPNEAVEGVDRGRHQCAVFMNATPLPAVTEIADKGEYMPQKSTYFQPKLQSGLVFSALK